MTTDHRDPFARIKAGGPMSEGSNAARRAGKGRQVSPAPTTAPPPPDLHPQHGRLAARWAYLDQAGEVLGYAVRFDAPGGKVVLPLTLRDDGRGPRWRWSAFDEPRPLYGLRRLAARPGAPVLVVEGEKTADAAGERLAAFVAVTWPGGSKAAKKADWSPLAGREVVIFPDADAPGDQAARSVVTLALAAGARSAVVVDLPANLPEGWDLADEWPTGFGRAEAEAAIGAARAAGMGRPPPPPAIVGADGVTWPTGYFMGEGGLFWEVGGEAAPQWLCDPFEVLGEGRGADGKNWLVVLRFKARDGRETVLPISRASLGSGGGEARSALADSGLTFNTGQGAREKLTAALMRVHAPRFVQLVQATGWHDERFVLPTRTIGPPGGEDLIFTGEAPSLKYGTCGELDTWRETVAARAVGNPLLMFALSCGFAAPLLRPLGAEGGGFHFRGNSSSGKSTLLVAAGSVWGGDPKGGDHGFGHTWRATANALESLALAHNDTLLPLDEFGQVDPAEGGVAAYALGNGEGKSRQKADGSLRPAVKYRTLIVSSGENSLSDHMASAARGVRAAAGQELRLLDIPADAGREWGIWERLAEGETPAARSEAVKTAAKNHFGHAGPLFLERLVSSPDAKTLASRLVATFCEAALRPGDTGQVARACRRFAVVAAAGELAALWGVTPWAPEEARQAVETVFQRWADAFGRAADREAREVLRRLRAAIQSEVAMFAHMTDDDTDEDAAPTGAGRDGEARSLRTYGFRWRTGGEDKFLFHQAGWEQVLSGFNPSDAARMVQKAGFLETDKDRGDKKSVKIKGSKQRFYCVSASILEDA